MKEREQIKDINAYIENTDIKSISDYELDIWDDEIKQLIKDSRSVHELVLRAYSFGLSVAINTLN